MVNISKKVLGQKGEALAANYLRGQGYRVIEHNFRCQYGEIDLICRDGDIWCFVEVKTRKVTHFGRGYESVNQIKQKHLIRAAQCFLSRIEAGDSSVRFDVVSIDFSTVREYRITLIRNAFSLNGGF